MHAARFIPVEVEILFWVVILVDWIHHLDISCGTDGAATFRAGLPLPSSLLLVNTGHQEICNGNPEYCNR